MKFTDAAVEIADPENKEYDQKDRQQGKKDTQKVSDHKASIC